MSIDRKISGLSYLAYVSYTCWFRKALGEFPGRLGLQSGFVVRKKEGTEGGNHDVVVTHLQTSLSVKSNVP